jgi:hypothetical protein
MPKTLYEAWFNNSSKILRETRRELKKAKRKAKRTWHWACREMPTEQFPKELKACLENGL